MKKNRRLLWIALIGLFLVVCTGLLIGREMGQQQAARDHLSQILGTPQELTDPMLRPQQPELPQGPDFRGEVRPDAPTIFGIPLPIPDAGVQVQESGDAYTLRVPLADAEDADRVSVHVTPWRIEVSGQTGTRRGDASFTSSFMQSFNTSQEVLPDQVDRKLEKQGSQLELVIIIPKKQSTSSDGQSRPAPAEPFPFQLEDPVPNRNQQPDPDDSKVLDDSYNRVF